MSNAPRTHCNKLITEMECDDSAMKMSNLFIYVLGDDGPLMNKQRSISQSYLKHLHSVSTRDVSKGKWIKSPSRDFVISAFQMKIDFSTNNATAYPPAGLRSTPIVNVFQNGNPTWPQMGFLSSPSLKAFLYFARIDFSPSTARNFTHTKRPSDNVKKKERKSDEERKDGTSRASRVSSEVVERC